MTSLSKKTSLIDGDIVCYRCAAASENEDVEIALLRVDRMMEEILASTSTPTYRVFIGGEDNFRYQFFPEYKANRKNTPKPKWLEPCKEYLVQRWNAEITSGYETDDALGMYQTSDTIICSIDKDLLQIPGDHYNFVTREFKEVDTFSGMKHFYMQLLHGDRTDNIAGLPGVGPKKAEKYLEGCETENEMLEVAQALYNDDILLDKYAKCLWIWKSEGDVWDKLLTGENLFEQEEVPPSGFTTPLPEATNQSTGPTTLETHGFQPVGLFKDDIDPTTPSPP